MNIGNTPSAAVGSASHVPSHEPVQAASTEKIALQTQAEKASEAGGMLVDHILAVQGVATAENICIMVRPVNSDAASLIGLNYGTKDMNIKGKSANLPPFSGLVPVDQSFSKIAFDKTKTPEARTEAIEKFNKKNQQAHADGTATHVPLNVLKAHFEHMQKQSGDDFVTEGTWFTAETGASSPPGGEGSTRQVVSSGVMRSTGSDGRVFRFWGEKLTDGSVSVFALDEKSGKPAKGEPVMVMGNREGKAVTADYDLAMVAPHVTRYGPEFTFAMKITSLEEHARRTGKTVSELESEPAPNAMQWDANQAFKADVARYRDGVENPELKEKPEGATRASVLRDQLQVVQFAMRESYSGDAKGAMKEFGNTTKFTKELVPRLNQQCGRESGCEVFHHGDDVGNFESDAQANYPMTVILPNSPALEGIDKVQIIADGAALTVLSKALKNAGFMPSVNDRWDDTTLPKEKRLTGVRSDAFLEAKEDLGAAQAKRRSGENKGAEKAQASLATFVDARKADVEAKAGDLRRKTFSANRDVFENGISPAQAQERRDRAQNLLDEAEQALRDAQAMRVV